MISLTMGRERGKLGLVKSAGWLGSEVFDLDLGRREHRSTEFGKFFIEDYDIRVLPCLVDVDNAEGPVDLGRSLDLAI